MSTTFAIKKWKESIDVAYRGRDNCWLNEVAELLSNNRRLYATDNTAQWIKTIWDFKQLLKKTK